MQRLARNFQSIYPDEACALKMLANVANKTLLTRRVNSGESHISTILHIIVGEMDWS